MIIIEQENETTFLNDRVILDCAFNRETGKAKVATPSHLYQYDDVSSVTYIIDGRRNGAIVRERLKE